MIRPLQMLTDYGQKYPQAWKLAEMMRRDASELGDWPAWCYLPMSGWYSIISYQLQKDRLDLKSVADLPILSAVGAWRYTQGIYRFDQALFDALSRTTIDRLIPVEVLYRMPEWCVYIETPDIKVGWLGLTVYGFFAHLEYDAGEGHTELRIVLDTDTLPLSIPLYVGEWGIYEALNKARHKALLRVKPSERAGMELNAREAELMQQLMSLILYICSDEPDISGHTKQSRPQYPQYKRVKKGLMLFPPSKPTIWNLGANIGEQLRQAEHAERAERSHVGDRKSPRPHLRRAHWHGYWTGKRDSEQTFSYRWMPPIVVAD
jgi:hypothetical protein